MLRLAGMLTTLRPPAGTIEWVCAGAEDVPLPDASATICWSLMAVHHWPDLEGGMAEVTRILRPGGRFLVLEKCVDVGATGIASHGWTSHQAATFGATLAADGYTDVVVDEHESGRRRVVTVSGRAPRADG
jgi:ubiquinone/menaquinone biosynthesis C-methylase UbiE